MEMYSPFMYFWLNYCDGNHIERIPIAVKNIDHLFRLASETIESSKLHLFYFLTLLESMIMTLYLLMTLTGAIDKSMLL